MRLRLSWMNMPSTFVDILELYHVPFHKSLTQSCKWSNSQMITNTPKTTISIKSNKITTCRTFSIKTITTKANSISKWQANSNNISWTNNSTNMTITSQTDSLSNPITSIIVIPAIRLTWAVIRQEHLPLVNLRVDFNKVIINLFPIVNMWWRHYRMLLTHHLSLNRLVSHMGL